VIIHEESQPLEEGIVFALNVPVLYVFPKNVFVKGTCKVALEKLIVVNGLGWKEERAEP